MQQWGGAGEATPAPPETDTPLRIYRFRFPFRMMSYVGALSKAKASTHGPFVPGVRPLDSFITRRRGWVAAPTGPSVGAWRIGARLFPCAVAGPAAAGGACCRRRSRHSSTTPCRSLKPFARPTPTRSFPRSRCVGPWRGWVRGTRITRRCMGGWPGLANGHGDAGIPLPATCPSAR